MSSLIRRLQIRKFKVRKDVELVPCPHGRKQFSHYDPDTALPVMVPVMVWPKFAPHTAQVDG